jgi:signal transduction histidine kinase
VTIRKTLLVAFLVVSLVPAMLLAGLAFVKAREALQVEIESNLAVEATSIAAAVDKMIFERLQNAATWSRLDVMQDMQVHDVDKRASRFLADLQSGYGDVYRNLSCIDPQGYVVCSSDAALIGQRVVRGQDWQQALLSGTTITLELPTVQASPALIMRVPVLAAFTSGNLGELQLKLDWSEIYTVLDQADGNNGRMLAILDREGRMIAASKNVRERGLLLSDVLSKWRWQSQGAKVREQSGQPLLDAPVIVGAASAQGYASFSGFGWTTLVIQPVSQALAPVHRMALIFLGLLVLCIALVLLISSWISHEIARPIVTLTGFAREYIRSKVLRAPPASGRGEVGELTDAFVQMVRDIDQSQQHLVRASKLAVVGEMSSVIAHEVRTPLGILRSSAQMLQREAGISAEGRELIGFIDSETERLNRLVSAMLDTARPRAPAFSSVDMHELIEHCIAMLNAQAATRGVAVSSTLRAGNPAIDCDEKQMTQVLLNLLMNGLQILTQGGRIEVATHDNPDNFYMDIADDGPGVDPVERKKVFEAFFFKREGGIGLGLAIVQQIVHAHGGAIEVSDSALGGALFRICLPREQIQ